MYAAEDETMIKAFELYAPFAPERSACVVAVKSPTHGYCVSRQQFLHAKRKLEIPGLGNCLSAF